MSVLYFFESIRNGFLDRLFSALTFFGEEIPVSYTHLDVYKRQVMFSVKADIKRHHPDAFLSCDLIS